MGSHIGIAIMILIEILNDTTQKKNRFFIFAIFSLIYIHIREYKWIGKINFLIKLNKTQPCMQIYLYASYFAK